MDTLCDVLILILQASPQGASNVLAVNWRLPGELTAALPVHNAKPAHDGKSCDVRLSLSDGLTYGTTRLRHIKQNYFLISSQKEYNLLANVMIIQVRYDTMYCYDIVGYPSNLDFL